METPEEQEELEDGFWALFFKLRGATYEPYNADERPEAVLRNTQENYRWRRLDEPKTTPRGRYYWEFN